VTGLRIGSRDRRALVTGAVAIAVMVTLVRAVPAVMDWNRDAREAALEERSALAKAEAMLARSGAVRESTITRGRRVIGLAPLLLGGETPNSAGASLAGALSGAAARAGVHLGVVQLRGDTLARDVFTRIGAHADATGDIRGVSAFLALLESGPPLLAVRSYSVTQPEPGAGDDRMETLRVEIDVEGLMLSPRTQSKP